MATRPYNGKYRAYFKYHGQQYSKVVTTKAEGKAWEVEEKKRLSQVVPLTPNLMYSAACEQYLNDCRSRVQRITFEEKRRYLREFVHFVGRDFPVQDVTPMLARQFIIHVWQERKGKSKSANRRLGELKTFWKWMGDEVPGNPWSKVQPYGEEKYTKYVPPPEDVAAILDKATPREKALLDFLLCTGARVGEAYQLLWKHVDFKAKELQLWTRKRKNSNPEPRSIPISGPLLTLLEDLWNNRVPGAEHVFINPDTGKPYERLQPAVRDMMSRLCKAAGVETVFGFHALRHYVAKLLIEGGNAKFGELQTLLGHQNATTTDIYLKSLSTSPIGHVAPYIEADVINRTMAARKAAP